MRIIDFNPELHKITFTNKQETVITESNIMLLKRMFNNPEKYQYYMKTLWLLRSLSEKKCCKDGMIDSNDEVYRYLGLQMNLLVVCYEKTPFLTAKVILCKALIQT